MSKQSVNGTLFAFVLSVYLQLLPWCKRVLDSCSVFNHCDIVFFTCYIIFLNICRTCEICGAIALNVAGEQTNEANNTDGLVAESIIATEVHSETRSLCHGRRIMNFLLACMILAFVISWLFHFHVLP